MNTAVQLHPDPFDQFWAAYPRKVGKKAARLEYQRALRETTTEAIEAGLQAYLRHLPDDPNFIPHPRTWLHQGRYEDEYEKPKQYSIEPRKSEVRTGEWWKK
jgi:hypothetical protein